ncbi:MAG: hypothetical protein WDW38_008103 [Sanguina aurantia]
MALQELRNAGLSAAKASYVSGMAKHFQEGLLNESDIAGLDDDSLNEALQVMKGVGPWTVQMCSMFHLGRADVLPVGDLGVRKGMQQKILLRHIALLPQRALDLARELLPEGADPILGKPLTRSALECAGSTHPHHPTLLDASPPRARQPPPAGSA